MCRTENRVKDEIESGKTSLGIELGSTRIKSVLIGADHLPIALGSFEWKNKLENGVWTYDLNDVWSGIQGSFKQLADEVKSTYGITLKKISSIGISAMMHGYLAFDKHGVLLVPFRTWRNTLTEEAAVQLTDLFSFNVPQRWSVAHLYQAMLNKEEHLLQLSFITTLAGYVHWILTGEKVLGIGDASGMFPIDSNKNDYEEEMVTKFEAMAAEKGFSIDLKAILPKVLLAGEGAGTLTVAGAKLLDPTGELLSGSVLCPAEGDAGTGMVATNSVAEKTGNVSAGTSIFAMIVLEKALSNVYTEIDMVTTPTGKPVAMVHCNNCTSDFDAWVNLFNELLCIFDADVKKKDLYKELYQQSMKGSIDCGGLLSYNFFSGEPITGLDEGRPLFVRKPDADFSVANFMRCLLFSTMSTLKLGMDILTEKEQVEVAQLLGHGGLFKEKGVGQGYMAAALNTPITVMESAGEGGAWGIALLAQYAVVKDKNEPLESFLSEKVFSTMKGLRMEPDQTVAKGFSDYINNYKNGLAMMEAAIKHF